MANMHASTVVTNCVFVQISGSYTGGIGNIYSSPTVTNCILRDNGPEPIFNMEYSESIVSFSCIQGGYEGEGNIDDDPLFVNVPWILQLREGSPCIQTGTKEGAPKPDILGRPRTGASGVDMGAYEGTVNVDDLYTRTILCDPEDLGRREPPAGSQQFFK